MQLKKLGMVNENNNETASDVDLRDLLFKIRQPTKNSQQQQFTKLLSSIKLDREQEQAKNLKQKNVKKDPTESSYNSLVGSLMSDSMQLDNEKVILGTFIFNFRLKIFFLN